VALHQKNHALKSEARNPKQGSKFEIRISKTKSKTRARLNALAIGSIKVTDGQIAAFVSDIETFDI
jgi:hypothetical protein